MKLGKQVGLGPGHMVLDWEPAFPAPKGWSPQFSAYICCGQIAAWIKKPLGMEVDLGPDDFALDGDRAPLPKNGSEPPNFRPMFIVPNSWMDRGGTWHGGKQPR